MPRPKLSERTKQCRKDLRVLLLWRLGGGQPVGRAGLKAWLAGHVEVRWGPSGRPGDLKSAEDEADAAIDHLLRHGNCEATGGPGHQTVRLVEPVPTLGRKVERLRAVEKSARRVAGRAGSRADGPSGLPRPWAEKAIKKVGERLARAVEKAVLEGLDLGPARPGNTPEHPPTGDVEEPCPEPSGGTMPPGPDDSGANGSGRAGRARKGQTGRANAEDQPACEGGEVVMLPVLALRPNDWNPNLMTEEQEAQVQEEVRRSGRPSHDILVRPLQKGRYQIIDGEHNWRAAKKAGRAEVPCRVVKVGDLEALRLTYMRNLHGTRDPLLTGRLFRRMLELAGVATESAPTSQRQFARDNNIDEATLRNYLLYARAAELRKHYAPETADESIRALSIARIRLYLELPEGRRDEWLDRGASTDEANTILAEAGKRCKGTKGRARAGQPAGGGHDRQPDVADGHDGEHADLPPTGADGGDGEQSDDDPAAREGETPRCAEPPVTDAESEPGEPLSQAEREVVAGALRAYRDGRPLVRQKILAGLAAHPDAVTFFRRMIKAGG